MSMGEETPDKGEFETGETAKVAYVDQSHSNIDPDKTIWQNFSDEQELVMTPEPGYVITDVTVDGLSVGAVDSYRIDRVRNDMSVSVRFGPAAQ